MKTVTTFVPAIPPVMTGEARDLVDPETIGDIQGFVTPECEPPWIRQHGLNGETTVTGVARRTGPGVSLDDAAGI